MRQFIILIISILFFGCNHPESADYSRDKKSSNSKENRSGVVSVEL